MKKKNNTWIWSIGQNGRRGKKGAQVHYYSKLLTF